MRKAGDEDEEALLAPAATLAEARARTVFTFREVG